MLELAPPVRDVESPVSLQEERGQSISQGRILISDTDKSWGVQMFTFIPPKFQNLVYGIILALTAYDILISLKYDLVFAINGDDRSTFLEFDN